MTLSAPRSGQLVVIGASTGGPRAVQSILDALPASFDACIIVALHMPALFTGPYAARLDVSSLLKVREARGGELLQPGDAFILPGGFQGIVVAAARGPVVQLRPKQSDEVYAPSADALMCSAASVLRKNLVGVVLTGMGDDGREGLAAIQAAGGFTLAESRQSAVVHGMPGGAVRAGVVSTELDLSGMPGALVARCGVRLLPPGQDGATPD
jgi:two-component system chemotaxis response regulator CheB